MIKYSKRLILFIDILGFKEFVNKSVNNEADYNKYIEFNEAIIKSLNIYPSNSIEEQKKLITFENSTITQFSDSIVISIDFHIAEQFEQLVLDIVSIISTGFHYGFIFRGAITFGKIIHDEKRIFGPGFIRSYEMENKLAVYPRVVIDNKVLDLPGI